MPSKEIATIKDQVKGLRPEQKVELIKFLADSLSARSGGSTPLEYGKYGRSGRRQTTAEDFKIAEWNPTDSELNGH